MGVSVVRFAGTRKMLQPSREPSTARTTTATEKSSPTTPASKGHRRAKDTGEQRTPASKGHRRAKDTDEALARSGARDSLRSSVAHSVRSLWSLRRRGPAERARPSIPPGRRCVTVRSPCPSPSRAGLPCGRPRAPGPWTAENRAAPSVRWARAGAPAPASVSEVISRAPRRSRNAGTARGLRRRLLTNGTRGTSSRIGL
jgi:hypothetical protein